MNKDRIEGSANQAKGAVKEAVGKMTGDAKLQTEGAADKAAGKVQNAGPAPTLHPVEKEKGPRLRALSDNT